MDNRKSESTRPNVVMIIPYFGTFPKWFNLYLYSCSRQQDVDFVFFTDCEFPATVYKNTLFHRISFADYCEHVSRKLDISFTPLSPYKLCDLKPFYGIIHDTLVLNYDFWGFADVDLVYGDLGRLLSADMLNAYNVITTHTNRVAGHFTIVRTESRYTKVCLQIKDWQTKLMDERHLSIDEDDWVFKIYPEVRLLRRLYRFLFKPLHIPMKYCYEGLINHFFCNRFTGRFFRECHTTPFPLENEKWIYNIDNGVMTNPHGIKIPYLHFLFFKKNRYKESSCFWQGNFYQCAKPLPRRGNIEIDINGISYAEQ